MLIFRAFSAIISPIGAFDWLTAEDDTDIIADGIVNWLDFTRFADNWLKTDPRYYNP